VHVLGALPALGLSDSGFLVTPVLAWSAQPRYLHPANPAKVTTVHAVPVATRGDSERHQPDADPDDGDGDRVRVGVMTAAIIEQLAAYLAAEAPPVAQGAEPCG